MKNIFTVTVIRYGGGIRGTQDDNFHPRTWGWYSTFARAENAILKNIGDMFEDGYYKHAVIEEMPEGIMPIPENMAWYSASYAKGKIKVIKIACPRRFKRTLGFSMG